MLSNEERQAQEKRLEENLAKIKYKLVIISGKGGVGKTTVSVNLAFELSTRGYKVGILDADIHGPNVVKMLGIGGVQLYGDGQLIQPAEINNNLRAISVAMLSEDPDKPIIWRGPLKTGIIKQFLSDVAWGNLDFLIIDSPPGTGDEPLSVCQLIKGLNGAIIVTTPQEVAILDSRKSVQFAKELKVPVVGIIENMSGFRCPKCGAEIDIFGKGGGEKAAKDLKVNFLGSLPFEPDIVKYSDEGRPYIHFNRESETAKKMVEIVNKIEKWVENPS